MQTLKMLVVLVQKLEMLVVLVQKLGAGGFGAKAWWCFWCKSLVLVILVQKLGASDFGAKAGNTGGFGAKA